MEKWIIPFLLVLIPKRAQGNLKLLSLVLKVFLFVDKGEHLILVLLCKANLERKEICASDSVKTSYIHIANPYSLWLVLHSRFGFALQEAYLQFRCR